MSKVIICIRARNEERWIRLLIHRLKDQTYKKFEVVLVDNNSEDQTFEVAKLNGATSLKIKNFNPSCAINNGIKSAKCFKNAEFAVILSAHCIPIKKDWLEKLILPFKKDKKIVGVYGRQLPMTISNSDNSRDLMYTFGPKSFYVKNQIFFHNANSAIRLSYFKKNLFDETISHIEDLAWAHKAISQGKEIFYSSDAKVWHWHGLHQHSEESFRSDRVLKTHMKIIDYKFPKEDIFELKNLKILFINEKSGLKQRDIQLEKINKKVANSLGFHYLTCPPLSKGSLFNNLNKIIKKKNRNTIYNLIFFWSNKYGYVSKNKILQLHKKLRQKFSDGVISVRLINHGLCFEKTSGLVQLSEEQNFDRNKFFYTSFGSGSFFWIDILRKDNIDKCVFSPSLIKAYY